MNIVVRTSRLLTICFEFFVLKILESLRKFHFTFHQEDLSSLYSTL